MKLSDRTISILKNFSTINPSILVHPGKTIKTVSPQKSIMATAKIDETIPNQFAIYDLSRFLGVTSLLKDPEFEFSDKCVEISTNTQTVRYTCADPEQIISPPNKDIAFPDPEIEFILTADELQNIIRAGSVLQMPEVAVVGKDGKISVCAVDSKNVSSDSYAINVGETQHEFNMIFKIEYLKFLPDKYDVAITSKGISRFTSEDVTYWVAIEANSTFG